MNEPTASTPQKHLPLQLIMLFNAAVLVIVILVSGIISYLDIQFGRQLSKESLYHAENTSDILAQLVDEQLPTKGYLHHIEIVLLECQNELDLLLQNEGAATERLQTACSDLEAAVNQLVLNWDWEGRKGALEALQTAVQNTVNTLEKLKESPVEASGERVYLIAQSLSNLELIHAETNRIEQRLNQLSEQTAQAILASNRRTTANAGTLSDLIVTFEQRYIITILIVIAIVMIFQLAFFIILRERLGSLIQITAKISGSGRLSERVNWVSRDEIGTLAQSFNRMLDRLEAAQNEISANEAYLDDIFQSMLNALIVINPDKTIRTVNQSLLILLGYSESELIHQPIDIIFPDHPSHLCPEGWILKSDQRHIIDGEEFVFLSKAGMKVPVLLSCSIVHDAKQINRGVVCVAQDISQLKQMQQERIKLEEQLRQSQKMEAIGTLAGGIAHDFNNILSTMQGFTWLLLADKEENSEERDYLNEIYTAGERAAGLIQQILTFSRTDSQDRQALKLSPLVKEALRFMRATIPTSIEIKQEIDPDCASVLANATQIHQIIINLCTNALHAMKNRHGTLTVILDELDSTIEHEIFQEFPDGRFVRIAVSDTGHGISPAIRNRIFEPFFTTKEVSEGTGLGLAVVHGIVKNHNGRIFVQSIENKGATFEIFLPVIEESERQTEDSDEMVPSTGNEHILIVEDEPSLARFFQIALSQLGYRVSHERNGEDALQFFKSCSETIDVVFTDQAMPTMTGIQLCQELKRVMPEIVVILATGYRGENLKEQAQQAGVNYFMEKPITIAALTQAIRHLVKGKAFSSQSVEEKQDQAEQSNSVLLDHTENIIYTNESFRDIVPLFLEERLKEIEQIKEALQRADYEEIYALGHKMQGASEAFGFTSVSEIGRKLKQSALKGENKAIQDQMHALNTYLDALRQEL